MLVGVSTVLVGASTDLFRTVWVLTGQGYTGYRGDGTWATSALLRNPKGIATDNQVVNSVLAQY